MIDFSQYFHYDSINGTLIWKDTPVLDKTPAGIRRGKKKIGGVAGSLHSDGSYAVRVKGVSYRVHRVIWEMHHGPIPEGIFIDHIDGNNQNNLLVNLRLATHGENTSNQRAFNSLGVKGVYKNGRGFSAKISVNHRVISIGTYKTKGLAAVAYAKASMRYHGAFSIFLSAPKKPTVKLQ